MSVRIPFKNLTPEIKKAISEKCTVKKSASTYTDAVSVFCFAVDNVAKEIRVPMIQWKLAYDSFPDRKFPRTTISFTSKLYTTETDPKGYRDQNVMMAEALEVLKEDHAVFLELATGFGKTACSTYIASQLKLKTLILCHLSTVGHGQWPGEFERFTTAKVQVVKGKVLDPSCDVYVMGVQKASGMPPEVFKDIGLVIYDEAHIATPTACTKALLNICPRYLVGLSATPSRDDGLQKLLYAYFGPRTSFIKRTEEKQFTVVKYKTTYKPEVAYKVVRGKVTMDWNKVINSLMSNVDRQREIADIAIRHPEHRIMILSDRNEECNGIYNYLIEKGVDAELLIGAKTKWNKTCRVLVAGMKKAGVGFNDPTLTMLIIATDVKSVEQYEGRIRTTNNIIYDVVDDFSTFESHWRKCREPWYLVRGATIKYEGGSSREEERERLLP